MHRDNNRLTQCETRLNDYDGQDTLDFGVGCFGQG